MENLGQLQKLLQPDAIRDLYSAVKAATCFTQLSLELVGRRGEAASKLSESLCALSDAVVSMPESPVAQLRSAEILERAAKDISELRASPSTLDSRLAAAFQDLRDLHGRMKDTSLAPVAPLAPLAPREDGCGARDGVP